MKTVWSYGGGTQSIAIAVLIFLGKILKPDHIIFADTGREASETMQYFNENLKSLFDKHFMKLEIAKHSLSKVDLYGKNGDLLIPAYTKTGKLPTFCSNEWKKRVVRRYMRSIGISKCRMILGFSSDEIHRMKDSGAKWIENIYPLVYEYPLTRNECRNLIIDFRLPDPPKSSCFVCPHRRNEQWLRLKTYFPDDWRKAVILDNDIREKDPEVFLHEDRIPLSEVDLTNKKNNQGELFTCNEFTCFT